MSANTSLLLTNPDFDNIKASLVNYLRGQDRFTDYDFEGSNLSVLLDVLSYNTYQGAFLTNMVASEMFLDTAQLDSSIISHAKELGYTARSARSAAANIDIIITPTDDPGTIIIPKNTSFSTNIGNESYTFITDEAKTVVVENNIYRASNVSIYEGFLVTEYFTANSLNTSQQFILSNADVDTNSIEVYVTTTGPEEQYVFASTIVDLNQDSKIFFIQQDFSKRYELRFGDNNIGYSIPHNASIRVVYRVCAADLPNGCSLFRPISTISGYTNISVVTNTVATGGAGAETNESIKKYAPLLYQTRGRAITESDYRTILPQQFPEINSINVYGGEKVDPPQYGKVVISVDVGDASGIPTTKKEEYYRYLKTKNPTIVEPIFIDPTRMYIQLSTTVYYDYTLTTLTQQDIESLTASAISEFSNTYLGSFKSIFRSSKLGNAIDSAHSSINSNDTVHSLYMIIDTDNLETSSQNIKFFNEVDTLNNYNVTSSSFKYDNKVCTLKDINGSIFVVTESMAGVTTNIQQVGTINYTTGEVLLYAFTIQELYSNNFKLIVMPKNKDIQAVYNNIIEINNSDVTINVVPQRR